ncbi:hypothetical protein ACL1HS_11000 [Corynebacterium striatum]|uniref:Uncharacterized protein n=1 Tax=Corynebacterium striatum TaxID=43770 RepID=A0ABX7DBZ5_CORST|nr:MULTISPECIES: hypothetical protein [Corynebacterium]EEI77692.1 hypothetical protein HMPREF0308_1946 [Corynebacterium striatum ATCC 6940]MCG7250530.1 hypothetical protein [Corynebacterium striatum]MDC7106726.1 hypothetical protein [Corynebacterium striatum]MDK7885221.1 hypothetical protein [Corynebacterium striatum]MDK8787535.1 hypothetical protein [Corynebacterium striatum]
MDFDSLLAPVIEFFSTGIGAVIAKVAEFIYSVLFPANAGAATTAEIG